MNHSTETALLKIVSDFRCNLDSLKILVQVLLDLSTAFVTVHPILLSGLRYLVGLVGTVFNWVKSYLTDSLKTHEIKCSLFQRPNFIVFILQLGHIIRRYSTDIDMARGQWITFCILNIKSWMQENFLQLNQNKNGVLVIGLICQNDIHNL